MVVKHCSSDLCRTDIIGKRLEMNGFALMTLEGSLSYVRVAMLSISHDELSVGDKFLYSFPRSRIWEVYHMQNSGALRHGLESHSLYLR